MGLPVVLQAEPGECGLACLAMVSSHFGRHVSIGELRMQANVSSKGMPLAHLLDAAQRAGLRCRPLRVELETLTRAPTPAILHWSFNHFVVLKAGRKNRITVHDPARGAVELTLEEASHFFTGVLVEVAPTATFEPRRSQSPVSLRSLIGSVQGLRKSVACVVLVALVLECIGLLAPLLTQWVIDDALVAGDKDLLTVSVIGIALLGFTRAALGLLRASMLTALSTQLNVQWLANVVHHLHRLPIAFFQRRHLGDITSRFGAVSAIQQIFTSHTIGAVLDGLFAVVTLGMMLVYSPVIACIALCASSVYAGMRALRYSRLKRIVEDQLARSASAQSLLLESLRGMQTLKLFGHEDQRAARYVDQAIEISNHAVEMQRLAAAFATLSAVLMALEAALVLWFGGRAVLDGVFTVGMLVAFVAYKDQFSTRTSSLIDRAVELASLRIHKDRLSDIVLTPTEDVSAGGASVDDRAFEIELRGVGFRYGDREPWIVRNLDLRIAHGESIAIVGPSGCGKTTLLKLMTGLLEPVEGEVLINGRPLHAIGAVAFRKVLGAVMQEDSVFAGTIAQNISFFDLEQDFAKVEACARMAGLDAEVRMMPLGYHSLVGEMNAGLSGGQVQRLLLARALYKEPRILLLDEATSHMDPALESRISSAIASLAITRVVIAHRQETIRSCDRVFALHAPDAVPLVP